MGNVRLDEREKPVVISIVATQSNMGKTTLIEKLIKIFKSRNYGVGVLKHDVHKFDIDKEGKDSWRFTQAGADNVAIASSEKLAMVQILQEERSIEQIIKLFENVDIILIEGFKKNNYPKIEVNRKGTNHKLLCEDEAFNKDTFIGIATDESLDVNIPNLDLNDAVAIADFIEKKLIKRG